MCANGLLTEGIVAIGNGTFLVDPGGSTLGGNHGDLVAAGIGLEHVGVATDDMLLVQCLHQSVFKLIRHQVATFGIHTFLQCVPDLVRNAVLGTGCVPEGVFILVGSTAGLGFNLGSCGLFGDGSGYRLCQLGINSLHTLHATNFSTQLGDGRLHAGVGGIVLCGQAAIFASVGLQECLCSFQSLCTLIAQFNDCHSSSSINVS